jgi:hypothetical protein
MKTFFIIVIVFICTSCDAIKKVPGIRYEIQAINKDGKNLSNSASSETMKILRRRVDFISSDQTEVKRGSNGHFYVTVYNTEPSLLLPRLIQDVSFVLMAWSDEEKTWQNIGIVSEDIERAFGIRDLYKGSTMTLAMKPSGHHKIDTKFSHREEIKIALYLEGELITEARGKVDTRQRRTYPKSNGKIIIFEPYCTERQQDLILNRISIGMNSYPLIVTGERNLYKYEFDSLGFHVLKSKVMKKIFGNILNDKAWF